MSRLGRTTRFVDTTASPVAVVDPCCLGVAGASHTRCRLKRQTTMRRHHLTWRGNGEGVVRRGGESGEVGGPDGNRTQLFATSSSTPARQVGYGSRLGARPMLGGLTIEARSAKFDSQPCLKVQALRDMMTRTASPSLRGGGAARDPWPERLQRWNAYAADVRARAEAGCSSAVKWDDPSTALE